MKNTRHNYELVVLELKKTRPVGSNVPGRLKPNLVKPNQLMNLMNHRMMPTEIAQAVATTLLTRLTQSSRWVKP